MPIVTVHAKTPWHIPEGVTQAEFSRHQSFLDQLLSALPRLVVKAHNALEIGGFNKKDVLVLPKLLPSNARNSAQVWIYLATGRPLQAHAPTIHQLKQVFRSQLTREVWERPIRPTNAVPQIDLDCEYRDWSGVSLDPYGNSISEW